MTLLLKEIIETKALQFAETDKPFWYTAGNFGPYYINTQYLYGSAAEAEVLLREIEAELEWMPSFYYRLLVAVQKQIEMNEIYKKVIDLAVEKLKRSFDLSQVDLISGGERRDYFFSIAIANVLGKPHLSIRKDKSTCLHAYENSSGWGGTLMQANGYSCIAQPDLESKRILHIVDIIAKGSSWVQIWLPAVEDLGGKIKFGFAVMDRSQGGLQILAEHGIEAVALEEANSSLFKAAHRVNAISDYQFELATNYLQNPAIFEQDFLRRYPDFLEKEISKGGDAAIKAAHYKKSLHERLI